MLRLTFAAMLAVVVLSHAAWAETIDIGPKIGANIPATFEGRDTAGGKKTFADLTGEKGAVLVFVRSAAWCPYCQKQLKEIQAIASPLSEKGYRLVSISYDAPEVLEKFAKNHGITYAMLSDKGSVIIDAFGIRDPQYGETSFAFGVPRPVIFVVDRSGLVRGKLAEEGYKVRPPVEAIMTTVESLSMPAATR